MQIISLFAFILFSISLLSESYYHVKAIGIDSASHGLLYRDRVVRRYGGFGNGEGYRGLQERAEPNDPKGADPKGAVNDPPKGAAKNDDAKNNDAKGAKDNDAKVAAPKDTAPKAKAAPKDVAPPVKAPPKNVAKDVTKDVTKDPPPPKVVNDPKEPKDQKNQLPPKPAAQQPDDNAESPLSGPGPDNQDQNSSESGAPPTVNTGGLSTPAAAGLASVGGVFVLVGGLFAFSKRRKNKEMTKNILSTSAKAWEQQDSTYEIMEEETIPIGSYIVRETYTPTLSDELDIQPGDKVTILVEFDDGWVQGVNETRGGTKGVFPRYCVDMNRTFEANNKRSSSMGGGYTEVDLS